MTGPSGGMLRYVLDAEPTSAPEAVGRARRMARRRRGVHLAWAGVVVATVAVGAGAVTAAPRAQPSYPERAAAPSPSTGHGTAPRGHAIGGPTRQGPVLVGAAADCVEIYSPPAVAGRAFAFDGTVTAIGSARSHRAGTARPLVGVTFWVSKWFRGGSGETVTVDWYPPQQGNGETDRSLASYGVGSRLLVSGEPRWGGAPLDSAIAWTCGFTRYYDPQTAAEWVEAIH